MDNQILFMIKPPKLSELCAVTVLCSPQKTVNNQSDDIQKTSLQNQIIRCREIIFTESNAIASPSANYEKKFYIIVQQSYYKTKKLQTRLLKMGLQVEKPRRVQIADFEACLRYTLLAKLAPLWNKVGDFMVQGRDFILNSNKMNALKMYLNVSDERICLALTPHVVRLPSLQLEDLGVPITVIREFICNRPKGIIQEYSIMNKWCYILPSMKRGTIVNILQELPKDGPFKNYKDVKKYWKNTYGYRLPESDDDLLYYQIYFKPIGERLFTYPSCCVKSAELITFPRPEPKPILKTFMIDMNTKMPNICGLRLNIELKAKYPVLKLLDMNEAVSNTKNDPNLTEYRLKCSAGYMDRSALASFSSQPPQSKTWAIPGNCPSSGSNKMFQHHSPTEGQTAPPQFEHPVILGSQTQEKFGNPCLRSDQCIGRQEKTSQEETVAMIQYTKPKIIPIFQKKHSFSAVSSLCPSNKQAKKCTPVLTRENKLSSVLQPNQNISSEKKKTVKVTKAPKGKRKSSEELDQGKKTKNTKGKRKGELYLQNNKKIKKTED